MIRETRSWHGAPTDPVLDGNSVHVWLAALPDFRSRVPEIAASLSSDELQRATRFRFASHRERFQLTRGLLRILLGKYLDRDARELEFTYGPHGKPALQTPGGDPLFHFNASHSGDFAAFAVTRVASVGVDIEELRPNTECEQIARKHFIDAELDELLALPPDERVRGFFNCWTRKEAFLKARGDGVFGGLSTFQVSLSARYARLVAVNGDASQAAQWTMHELPEFSIYVGAVAIRAPNLRLAFWKMQSDSI